MNVLYVGSGRSALLAAKADPHKYTICAVNNAWRIFPFPFDYWIYSGDFPQDNFPLTRNFKKEVSHFDYETSSAAVCKKIAREERFPQHHLGYTIFFQGLYWIIHHLQPRKIYMLGFDHDYDPAKVKKWKIAGEPSPQNHHLKLPQSFFETNLSDSFYGYGTPDPMRLGDDHMRELFQRAGDYSTRLGVLLLNASGVTNGLNPFPQEMLP
ncbi:MAG: hypothetical protein J0L73_14410 [Verrucomicrobia bacterium]|nr:hypothetical protein [Verrucomicrobiota bacterium]